jgi:hypothetical protein
MVRPAFAVSSRQYSSHEPWPPSAIEVIDIIPYELSAEAYQNSEASLAVGLIR